MWNFKKLIIITGLLLSITLALFDMTGCSREHVPVYYIKVFKASQDIPPSFAAGIWEEPSMPHPELIQTVLSPGDKIYLGLVINRENKKNITFSRYIFFNKRTGQEIEVGNPDDLGPFEPGQILIVSHPDFWTVPEQLDIYELRVYMGNDIVASALFEVK
jgi:hypothetical protein